MTVTATNTFTWKLCNSCKESKILSDFVKCKGKIHTYCKKCQNKKSKLWRESNREAYLENQSKYREARGYEGAKNSALKYKYGITLEDYYELLKSQNNCCAICHGSETYEFNVLVVDHCHTTGKIRGLLCTRCNKGLGMFKDSILALESAANYLKED